MTTTLAAEYATVRDGIDTAIRFGEFHTSEGVDEALEQFGSGDVVPAEDVSELRRRVQEHLDLYEDADDDEE